MDTQRTESKNQHYVPKMLLRPFAVEGTGGSAIAVLDADKNQVRAKSSIRHQCAKNFIYGKDGIVEKRLARLEGVVASTIKDIVRTLVLPEVRTEAWSELIAFIAAQHGRTEGAGREHNKRISALNEGMVQSAKAHEAKELAARFAASDGDSNPELESLLDSLSIAPLLFDLKDAIIVNESDIEFAISDLGVVLHNHWSDGVKAFGNKGFICHGIIFFLPISPRHLLIKYDPFAYQLATHKNIVQLADVSAVKALNGLQVLFAERNVYFTGHESTREALQRIVSNTRRCSRASQVRISRFVQSDRGSSELLMLSSESPKVGLNLPWLRIRKNFASIPLRERFNRFRPEATRAAEKLGFVPNSDLRPSKNMIGTWLRRW